MRGKPVTILRPGPRDKFGDPVDPANPFVEISESGWIIAPAATSDVQDGKRNSATARLTAYTPYATIVRHSDNVRLSDGSVWQVDGDPSRWESPFTRRRAGATVDLERFTG